MALAQDEKTVLAAVKTAKKHLINAKENGCQKPIFAKLPQKASQLRWPSL